MPESYCRLITDELQLPYKNLCHLRPHHHWLHLELPEMVPSRCGHLARDLSTAEQSPRACVQVNPLIMRCGLKKRNGRVKQGWDNKGLRMSRCWLFCSYVVVQGRFIIHFHASCAFCPQPSLIIFGLDVFLQRPKFYVTLDIIKSHLHTVAFHVSSN